MKSETVSGLVIGLILAFVAVLGFVVWWVGRDTMIRVVSGLAICIGLSAVLLAAAPAIRAFRKRDPTGETHTIVHDGTVRVIEKQHTIDGRQPVQNVLALGGGAGGRGALTADVLLDAYRAGSAGQLPASSDLAAGAGDDWSGDITP